MVHPSVEMAVKIKVFNIARYSRSHVNSILICHEYIMEPETVRLNFIYERLGKG